MKRSNTALVVLLALAGLLLALHSAAAAEPSCDLSIVMSPGEREAPIAGRQPSAVTFLGSFALTKPPNETGTVRFNAVTSTGWLTTVSPSLVIVGEGPRVNGSFNVIVIVPAREDASKVGRVNVTAQGEVGPLGCGPSIAQSTVRAKPYWGELRVAADVYERQAEPPSYTTMTEFTVQMDTNVATLPLVRLSVLGPPAMRHDAPESLQLTRFENGTASGKVWVNFTMAEVPTGSYEVVLLASNATPDYRDVIQGAELLIVVPPRLTDMLVLPAAAGGGVVMLATAVWLWRRPPRAT